MSDDSLDRSFDRVEGSLDRLAAADAMNTAAILNAIDEMRAEFEAKAEGVSAQLGKLGGELRTSGLSDDVRASNARIMELLAVLAEREAVRKSPEGP